MVTISVLNQKGGVGKTTLSIHLATALSAHGTVILIDADQQSSALDWKAARTAPDRFPVLGLPKATLHREVPTIGAHYDFVVIDGPPRANDVAKSAVAASDLVLIPVQPSPFDVWAASEVISIINECAVIRPNLVSRFVINRLFPGTKLGQEVRDALSGFEVPVLEPPIRNRTEYAKAVRDGLTALETNPTSQAALDIEALASGALSLLEVAHVS